VFEEGVDVGWFNFPEDHSTVIQVIEESLDLPSCRPTGRLGLPVAHPL
jgi:hypothetical protein